MAPCRKSYNVEFQKEVLNDLYADISIIYMLTVLFCLLQNSSLQVFPAFLQYWSTEGIVHIFPRLGLLLQKLRFSKNGKG